MISLQLSVLIKGLTAPSLKREISGLNPYRIWRKIVEDSGSIYSKMQADYC